VKDLFFLDIGENPHSQVSLILAFRSQNLDTVVSTWEIARKKYQTQFARNLEQDLFYKATYLMRLAEDSVSLQILSPFYKLRFYTEKGKLQTEVERDTVRTQTPKPIKIDLKPLKLDAATFRAKYGAEKVFEKVHAFALKRYEKKKPDCKERNPKVKLLYQDENQLKLEVQDLCAEVLVEEGQPLPCRLYQKLGYECNWRTRELLVLTFTYIPDEANKNYTLSLTIDGKVGSGYYDSLPRSGYREIEEDYPDEFKRYADGLMLELRKYLR
ncbi:MAG: hypothetical protein ACKVTZ_00920, partial [Bacteroidia bacterium]